MLFSAYMFNWIDRQFSKFVGHAGPPPSRPKNEELLDFLSEEEWQAMEDRAKKGWMRDRAQGQA